LTLPKTIGKGRRNDMLFREACKLRAGGLDADEVLVALGVLNRERCTPPLDARELQAIVTSACTHPARGEHCTDLGNARRLVGLHGDDLQYCHPWERWLAWDGTRWALDDTAQVGRWATDVPTALLLEAAGLEGEERKARVAWAMRSQSVGRLHGMVALAQAELPVLPDDLDADPWVLNCQNGTVDLRTGELHPHDREQRITKLAPVDYDLDATAPQWDAFLERILPSQDTRDFVQRAVGYSLTGDTSERALFILHGTGANGKTTTLEAIRGVLGDYSLRTPTSTLMARQGDSVPSDVARLRGARFVSASETEDGRAFSESLLKDLTGKDTVSARFMYSDFFEFRPTCKLWLGTNHKPRVRGTDDAIWDRLKLIPFGVRIPEAEQDKHLSDKLALEAPGILAWAVLGCLAWQTKGLGVPQEVKDATQEYREESDVLGDFIDDVCIEQSGASVTVKALHDVYMSWCERNGEKAMTKVKLGWRLREKGYTPGRTQTGARTWEGLGLLDKHTPQQETLDNS